MKKNVIVTGGCGYIGGQIAIMMADAGHRVTVIDRAKCPDSLVNGDLDYHQLDFDSQTAHRVMLLTSPDAIIHCAGTSLVGPSMTNPQDYYQNNVVKTQRLIDFVKQALPATRIIFSSSAAVYGEPVMTPCHEVDPCDPISPYGRSKLAIEWMLRDYRAAYGLDYVAFRFFNACGADSAARHGQQPGATHIIARALESVRDQRPFVLYGANYPTPDGTCIRDYVHVEDIARAHLAALDPAVPSGVYNLASSDGTSNRQIIAAVTRITGRPVDVQEGAQRPGDPPRLTADSTRFDNVCPNWRQYSLDHVIEHAWKWYTAK
jgi:UDP-glucose 4-epimerase